MRHQRQNPDDLCVAFHPGQVDHTAARRKDAVIWAVGLKNVAGQVVVFVPAGDYLLGRRQRRVNEDEWGIVFKESAAVKAIKRRAKDFDRVCFAGGEQVGQSKALGAEPWNAVHVVLNQKAAHDNRLGPGQSEVKSPASIEPGSVRTAIFFSSGVREPTAGPWTCPCRPLGGRCRSGRGRYPTTSGSRTRRF